MYEKFLINKNQNIFDFCKYKIKHKLKKNLRILFLIISLITFPSINCSEENIIQPTNSSNKADSLYNFINCLINPSTGLVSSRENESFTTVYKNSLSAMAFIHQNEMKKAERIFDVFQNYYLINKNNFNGFPQIWNANSGLPDLYSDRWEGDNAFLLLALNYYKMKNNGSTKFSDLTNGLINWLSMRSDYCYEIYAEGVANMYASLVPYSSDSTIQQKLIKLKNCFYSKNHNSSVDYQNVLDHTVRGSLVFCDATGFNYLNNFKRVENWSYDTTKIITAYSAFSWENFINIEISTQILLAIKIFINQLSSEIKENNELNDFQFEIEKLLLNGKCNSATLGLPYFVSDTGFSQSYSLPIVDSTCFLLFYYWGFNPFAPDKICANEI
ncbi:MAG: hypothetical protein STSR0008_14390 [Ignavibacterium sp.]